VEDSSLDRGSDDDATLFGLAHLHRALSLAPV
jgi:hypothetical protein